MSKDPIKHHYVPRAYLRRFSYDNKHTYVLRKNENRITSASIDDICVERDFYSMFDGNKHRYVNTEKAFSKLEDKFPNKIFELIPKDLLYPYYGGGIILDPSQKTALIEAILMQITRGKATREYGQSVAESLYWDLLAETKNKYKGQKDAEKQIKFLEQNKEIVLNNAMVEGSIIPFSKNDKNSELRNNLQRRNCIIFINHTGEDLITSDDPILVGNYDGDVGKIFSYPLGDVDSIVYYPLDSNHLAILCTQERCGGSYCDKGLLATLTPKDIGLIRNLNVAQYRQCVNCIIARKQDALKRTRNLLKKKP